MAGARRNRRNAAWFGRSTPHVIGRIHTVVVDQPALNSLLTAIGSGVTELMVHPGYVDEALTGMRTRLLDSRKQELDLLCSADTRALILNQRIALVRHDLTHIITRSVRHVS